MTHESYDPTDRWEHEQTKTQGGPVIVETMPAQHRESHRAARNWGTYPANGAVRLVATIEDAEALVADDPDEYTEIIQDHVTPADREQYADYVGQEI